MPPLVSVLVTVYNRERYLGACIESILASSFRDLEVVVVDDQSKDWSLAIARDYASKDTRVRVYQNERNLGDYPNRNRAASLALGRYLKYVDADDMIYPYSLGIMVEEMEKHPDAALGLSWKVVDPPQPYSFVTSCREVIKAHFLGRSLLGGGPSGAIIRRNCFESVGGFSGRQFIGDSELWLKLVERWPLVSLPPALVWWRQHEEQQIRQELANPSIMTSRLQCDESAISESSHLSIAEKSMAMCRLRQHHARRLWSLAIRERRPSIAARAFAESGLSLGTLLSGLGRYR